MTTATETAERFGLDESKARALIARALRRSQSGQDGPAPEYETLSLAPAWDPMSGGGEHEVSDLIYAATECGAITQPARLELDFQYLEDCDGGMFQWAVILRDQLNMRVTSAPEEYRKLGWRGAKGTAGQAMTILREAVEYANRTVNVLGRYVAASAPDQVSALLAVADDQEDETITRLARRAGLRWQCREVCTAGMFPHECGWENLASDDKCDGCGSLRPITSQDNR
jgi:hypothetical protein